MEVLLGAAITVGVILFANFVLRKPVEDSSKMKIKYSQSHIYTLMIPALDYMPSNMGEEKIRRQSNSYIEKSYVRVVIAEDTAYWIKDNALFTASVVDGSVDKESTRRVDTMAMDSVELQKTMTIVEKLREGLDEDSGAGK